MNHQQYDIVIIGAGLTGLTLAHYLKNSGKSVLVLEQKPKPGGVIGTRREKDFIYEEGPNTGVIKYGEVAELFGELSGSCSLYIPDKRAKKRYIWKNGKWEKLPSGLAEGIKTPLFSTRDKLRLLGEPFRSPGKEPEETLDRLVRRRLGESFLNYAVDPFILGVYAGDPSLIVPKYALPKLYRLEQDYGSFIGGSVKKMWKKKDALEKKATKDVFSVKGGLENLVRALHQSAGKENFLFNVRAAEVYPKDDHFRVAFRHKGEPRRLRAGQVVSTTGAYALPGLLPFLNNEEQKILAGLQYARVIQAAVGFRRWPGPQLNGFGGLVPHIEKRDILGALFMSSFLPERAPQNGALLSVFMGGVRRNDICEKTDYEIKKLLAAELKAMFGLKTFDPDLLKLHRYENAIPQYSGESGKRLKTIRNIENRHKGLIVAGNVRDGIGMADRIKQAADIARLLKK